MRSQIIQIGNSQGIRLPKMLLEESRITGEVELELHADGILIRNAELPRAGWDEAFRALADENEEELDVPAGTTSFDAKEWKW